MGGKKRGNGRERKEGKEEGREEEMREIMGGMVVGKERRRARLHILTRGTRVSSYATHIVSRRE